MHQQMVFSLFISDQSDTWVDLLIVFVLWPGVYCTQQGVCDTLWLLTVWQSRLKYLNNNFMACHYSLYWHLWSSEDESSDGFRSPQVPHTGVSSLSKITLKFAADIYFALRTIIVIVFHLLPSSHQNFNLSSTLLYGHVLHPIIHSPAMSVKNVSLVQTETVTETRRRGGNISADSWHASGVVHNSFVEAVMDSEGQLSSLRCLGLVSVWGLTEMKWSL